MMPELPDVENYKRLFEENGLNRKIQKVSINDAGILKHLTKQKLQQDLKDHTFTETIRHGKFLLAHISNDQWLAMHFGMTGSLKSFSEDDEPEYAKVVIDFADDSHLAYVCTRKLGKITLTGSPQEFIQAEDLGPDALDKDYSKENFIDAAKNKTTRLKSLLMDQSFIAGIGNIYADEILYQAGIHPDTKASAIDEKHLGKLYQTIHRVLKVANNHQGKVDDFPKHYLLPHRTEGEECPECKGKIEKTKVSGRSTYYCPKCQKKAKD